MKRIISALSILVILLLCSCSDPDTGPPEPITDGIKCFVSAQRNGRKTRYKITADGEVYRAVAINSDNSEGIGMSVSPSGCSIEMSGVIKSIDFDCVSATTQALVYSALRHKYTAGEYSGGKYRCRDDCGDYTVSLSDDGLISSINFSDYNCICSLDYRIG